MRVNLVRASADRIGDLTGAIFAGRMRMSFCNDRQVSMLEWSAGYVKSSLGGRWRNNRGRNEKSSSRYFYGSLQKELRK